MHLRIAHKHATLPILLAVLLLSGCAIHPDDNSLSVEWEKFKLWGRETTDNTRAFFTDEEYRDEVIKRVNSWFTDVSMALHGNSVSQMAAHASEADQLAAWSSEYDSMQPYGTWLATRSAYYEAAQEAVALNPDPNQPQPPPPPKLSLPPPPPPRGTITVRPAQPALPPPRPKHAPLKVPPPPPDIELKRQETVANSALWRQRVARHPLPARAPQLQPRLEAAFRQEGLPTDLIWLAEVESTFNPAARSPAGAVGLFQLMPATARSLGLTTSNPDQRLNPDDNAAAAARYLRYLYQRFNSWPLALAAYNCGEGRVAGHLRRSPVKNYTAISRHLPLETRMYLPRVLETIRHRTGRDPEKLPPPGPKLAAGIPPLDNPTQL